MSRKTIFLVDDDPTNLSAGRNALEAHYAVLALKSGEALIKALEKKTPDLILLDVGMPDMDGYETLRALRANPETANIPTIFLTGKNDDENELMGLSLGAVDYVTKPFSPPRLLKRIEMHMLIESQRRELVNFNTNLRGMVEEKTAFVLELQDAILKTMAELVEYRDDDTGGHIERTMSYMSILIDAMAEHELYKDRAALFDKKSLAQSAALHDVGKIAISDTILKKPGKLTAAEFEEIKKHAVVGREIIENTMKNTSGPSFLEHAAVFAHTHHEKWDGTGYPLGLKGEDIPLEGRMMAIADVYDALVSDRPYKKAFSHEDAVSIIVDSGGKHFDPGLTELFTRVSGEFDKVHSNMAGS